MSISISLKRCRCISVSVTSSVYPSFFSISYSCSLFSPSLYFLLPSLPIFRVSGSVRRYATLVQHGGCCPSYTRTPIAAACCRLYTRTPVAAACCPLYTRSPVATVCCSLFTRTPVAAVCCSLFTCTPIAARRAADHRHDFRGLGAHYRSRQVRSPWFAFIHPKCV